MSKMASAAPLAPQAQATPTANSSTSPESAAVPVVTTNGNHHHHVLSQEPRPPPAPPVAPAVGSAPHPHANNKKGNGGGKAAKKPLDQNETMKLMAQRISQLEHDAAGEKDQEAEIGACLLSSTPMITRAFECVRVCECPEST